MDHDGLIASLAEISGCAPDLARDLLNSVDWTLEAALDVMLPGRSPVMKAAPKFNPAPPPRAFSPPPGPPPPPKEKLILATQSSVFQGARDEAVARKRWLIVYISQKPAASSVLKSASLRDFLSLTFHGLDVNMEDLHGRYCATTYGITDFPCILILDPLTGECLTRYEGRMFERDLYGLMHQFLEDHPDLGGPIEEQMRKYEHPSPEPSISSENEEEPPVDTGNIINVGVQMPDGKRTRLAIGELEKVRGLCQKIGTLIEKKPGTFKLFLGITQLTDMDITLAELKCDKALVRVQA
jgi:hypothetical protein